jgi:hypothetical protein
MNQPKDMKYTTQTDFKQGTEEVKAVPRNIPYMPKPVGKYPQGEYLPKHNIMPKQTAAVPQRSKHMMKF